MTVKFLGCRFDIGMFSSHTGWLLSLTSPICLELHLSALSHPLLSSLIQVAPREGQSGTWSVPHLVDVLHPAWSSPIPASSEEAGGDSCSIWKTQDCYFSCYLTLSEAAVMVSMQIIGCQYSSIIIHTPAWSVLDVLQSFLNECSRCSGRITSSLLNLEEKKGNQETNCDGLSTVFCIISNC